jgi:hypothetical protein
MEILGDFTTSLKKALKEIDSNYETYEGLVIAGSHAPVEPEYIIGKIKEYREAGNRFTENAMDINFVQLNTLGMY